MIVKQSGGMTEFIPSPREKREGLIMDNALKLIENLHERLKRIEEACGVPLNETERFEYLIGRIKQEEKQTRRINEKLIMAGGTHEVRMDT